MYVESEQCVKKAVIYSDQKTIKLVSFPAVDKNLCWQKESKIANIAKHKIIIIHKNRRGRPSPIEHRNIKRYIQSINVYLFEKW